MSTKVPALKSVDLGAMQTEVEAATKAFKTAGTNLNKANIAFAEAEERYNQANRALLNGVNAVRAGTKMVF
jgi:hypothetical protein